MSTITYRTKDGDMIDHVCWRFYKQQSGAVEAVLEANPGLCERLPLLPANIVIVLPELPKPVTEVQPIRLWG